MLIKDIDTVQEIVNHTKSIDFDQIKSSIQDAENEFIIPVIGKTLYDELNEAYEPVSPSLDEFQTKLLPLIQKPLAYFAVMLWLPEGMVKVTGDGVQIVSTENMKTAWQWQTDKLEFKYLKAGYRDIDFLLEYLEENKDDYISWRDGSAYTITRENFINDAKDFSKIYDIGNSRRIFLRLKAMMVKAEDFYIKSNLGNEYFDALKADLLDNALNADDKITLSYIKKATAHLTIYRALEEGILDIGADGVFINMFTDGIRSKNNPGDNKVQKAAERALEDGRNYLYQMKTFLNLNASEIKYEDYFNGSAYVDPTSASTFNNAAEKGYFNAR